MSALPLPNVSAKKVVAVDASGVASRTATVIDPNRVFFMGGGRFDAAVLKV